MKKVIIIDTNVWIFYQWTFTSHYLWSISLKNHFHISTFKFSFYLFWFKKKPKDWFCYDFQKNRIELLNWRNNLIKFVYNRHLGEEHFGSFRNSVTRKIKPFSFLCSTAFDRWFNMFLLSLTHIYIKCKSYSLFFEVHASKSMIILFFPKFSEIFSHDYMVCGSIFANQLDLFERQTWREWTFMCMYIFKKCSNIEIISI